MIIFIFIGLPFNVKGIAFEIIHDTTQSNVLLDTLVIDLKNISQIEQFFKKQEQSWFSKYGTVIVAIVALIGTILTTTISNWVSRKNTEEQISASKKNTEAQMELSEKNLMSQINSSEKNLQFQIESARSLENQKRSNEIKLKRQTELKEIIARFLYHATNLNSRLNYIIYHLLAEGNTIEAKKEYTKTENLRNELSSFYFLLKINLEGSQKYNELELLLDNYMDLTCFKFDLITISYDDYKNTVTDLINKVRVIMNEN